MNEAKNTKVNFGWDLKEGDLVVHDRADNVCKFLYHIDCQLVKLQSIICDTTIILHGNWCRLATEEQIARTVAQRIQNGI
jgi:hypothetical protein